jgi:hypothetical protein
LRSVPISSAEEDFAQKAVEVVVKFTCSKQLSKEEQNFENYYAKFCFVSSKNCLHLIKNLVDLIICIVSMQNAIDPTNKYCHYKIIVLSNKIDGNSPALHTGVYQQNGRQICLIVFREYFPYVFLTLFYEAEYSVGEAVECQFKEPLCRDMLA